MDNLTIWLTYHKDSLLEEFSLAETDTIKLFKGNDTAIDGDNINHLNAFYSELTTMYYVWKNKKQSRLVGFCHYRRIFPEHIDIEPGQCQVLAINHNSNVLGLYKYAHNYQDFYDAVDILNERYGESNKYSAYMLKGTVFIPYCCFIMHYDDFEKLAEWLFDILFAWDKKNELNLEPVKYQKKAERDFRYDNIGYQRRAVAFLAERLISCYIVCNIKPFSVNTLL
ncbi:MAG: DUF4422 domain-containing protein [Prevotellaceae bacterium]|nr:DUF4422 domain-containing protein [Prevotellaceae bacterium]